MNKDELIKRLVDIEWEDFEVKKAKSSVPKNSWETVSAFSNTAGGWLIFGVSKDSQGYKIVGVSHPEKIDYDFDHYKITFNFEKETAKQDKLVGKEIEQSWNKFGTNLVSRLSQACPKLVPSEIVAKIILFAQKPSKLKKIMKIVGKTNRTRFKKNFINPMINKDLLKMTMPDKTTSPKQKYMITRKGKKLLQELIEKTEN